MSRMRASVLVILRALLLWTAYDSVAFTDVCACVSGSVMARSPIKSEYAQSLVDPKRTLFDVNIERRRYSSDRLIGAVTALEDAVHATALIARIVSTWEAQLSEEHKQRDAAQAQRR